MQIKIVDMCKDLGVVFSSTLSWSYHISKILNKAYRLLYFIKRTFPSASTPIHIKKTLYLSLVLPLVTYASPVWRPSLLKDIKALEKLQKRATKYILGTYPSTDYKTRLTTLKLLPLMYRYELNDIMFYITATKHPDNHFDINEFITRPSSGTYCTRSTASHKLSHSTSTSSLQHHFYFHRLPRLWNSLPPINLSLSIKSLKSEITYHFINHFINHFDHVNTCTYHTLCPCSSCSSTPKSCLFN